MSTPTGLPSPRGLYDPRHEHDACGVGFVANLNAQASHEVIVKGVQILENLAHRGACGCDPETGDGAGVLIQLPHALFKRTCQGLGFSLPAPGEYGVGMVFLPVERQARLLCEGVLERIAREEGLTVLGWREPPVHSEAIGPLARASQPFIEQLFVQAAPGTDPLALERKLYLVRRRAENEIAALDLRDKGVFYLPSFSSRTIVYKGLLLAPQITKFYEDLSAPDAASALCMVHQRFSTNTFPTWHLAHPYRMLCHNGEINTLKGNLSWMNARHSVLASPAFGADFKKLLPVVVPGGSDSAALDNAAELLTLSGRSLPHVLAMLIPEVWEGDPSMSPSKKAFYEFHAGLMEPWDGPAAVAFTDGRYVGATLDRNGLRPARWLVTRDDVVILASEAGALQVKPEDIRHKGRLQPGHMLIVDLAEKRIVPDEEFKERLAARKPYAQWIKEKQVAIDQLPDPPRVQQSEPATLPARQRAFGYTDEDLRLILSPMAEKGEEPVGSMGADTPLACLSEKPQPLFHYFRQLFAQVTNPPIDPIREELVMTLTSYIGNERNILDETAEQCHMLKLPHPILTNRDLEKLRRVSWGDFLATTLPMLYRVEEGERGIERALTELCRRASLAIKAGYSLLILSDRGHDELYAPIPSLLALSAVHHHLVREALRTQAALVVETGEPREVMHFAMLIGYGASALNPYLALETIEDLVGRGLLQGPSTPPGLTVAEAQAKYVKAVNKGLLKVFSRMGISTLQSYRGAQVFEAVGLSKDLVDKYFTGTSSRLGGIGLDVIAREVALNHAWAQRPARDFEPELAVGGVYQLRVAGEHHLYNPQTIAAVRNAVRDGKFESYRQYADLLDGDARKLCTLRGLMQLKPAAKPIPLEEVEPAKDIVKRFATGAMSFGSISREAHETLALAMNRIGARSNTGEGGEESERFVPGPNGESRRSAIKQVASARFGVTANYLVNADELQIKIAQGAKPGEGGQLPGHKVDAVIAKVRHAVPGVQLISPPPHHDIYSIEDLSQLIYDLKNVNPRARVSVKLVSEVGVGTVAAGVAKARADVILISGDSGGTGASPLSSIRHVGVPWELGLAEAQQVLVLNDLRSRVRLQTDGKLMTGRDVVIAALLGAEEFGFATLPLVAMGCVMMRKCHLNTCPVGIATQDPVLRARFEGTPDHVINLFFFIAEDVRQRMAQLGFRTVDEMIGRVDRLEMRPAVDHWKAQGLDFSQVLFDPPVPRRVGRLCRISQDHDLKSALDNELIAKCRPSLEKGERTEAGFAIRNVHRSVGAMLGGEVARRYGEAGLPDDTISLRFTGSAGQSFGAFVPRGVTLVLEGEANDYVGKGLSGGKLAVFPPKGSTFAPEENVLVGNVVLYGATSGEAYFNGMAGERFAVRNSGARVVVEGVGDHGCEYMTNGLVVVLGRTGRNFAAGMTGGLAYVLDESGSFASRWCNKATVDLFPVQEAQDVATLEEMLRAHLAATSSPRARSLLERWPECAASFVKVFPKELQRVLAPPPPAVRAEVAHG
ncbi:MAG TPA: glutamate synthase large subunit [Myxococcales bacterium]|jgi:glutamate synthase domain-containing protein 2/glutamate synthase domain-containing protein 1/glutamate synthase domain-containing protein 3